MTENEIDLPALRHIVESCSGAADDVDWEDTGILETTFDEMGYDSIALLEISARLEREYGVRIPDDTIPDLTTPRIVLRFVNDQLATA